jgi:hypothetical protein
MTGKFPVILQTVDGITKTYRSRFPYYLNISQQLESAYNGSLQQAVEIVLRNKIEIEMLSNRFTIRDEL